MRNKEVDDSPYGWRKNNGEKMTMEEVRHVFSQTIGYQVRFTQYSSTFLGMVTEVGNVTVTASLCKDSCVVPTLLGIIEFDQVAEINPAHKELILFPDEIISMIRIRKK